MLHCWFTLFYLHRHRDCLSKFSHKSFQLQTPPSTPHMARKPLECLGFLTAEASRSHSDTPHSVGLLDSSEQMIGPSQRPLPDNTQHPQQTNIHDSGGIRNRSQNKRKAANPRLRPRGHWDRLLIADSKHKCVVLNNHWPCIKLIRHGNDTNKCLIPYQTATIQDILIISYILLHKLPKKS